MLLIDFNKASNSVPHGTLWTVLERANFSTSAISLKKQLYSFPQDSLIINGRGHHAYLQTRGVWQGLAQLALHNPHIWANSLKPVCFLCFLLFWCPLLPVIETGTLKIYTKMVLYMKNEFF